MSLSMYICTLLLLTGVNETEETTQIMKQHSVPVNETPMNTEKDQESHEQANS